MSTRPLTVLSEDEDIFKGAVLGYAREEIGPKVAEMDAAGAIDPGAVPLAALGAQERSLLATFMADSGLEDAANYEIEGFESQLQRIGATNAIGGTPNKYSVFSSDR